MTMRWISVVHAMPGRTRLRTPVLRKDRPACERLADVVASIPGVRDVAVRPYTGSVLVEHDDRVSVATLLDTVQRTLGCDKILAAGERPPIDATVPAFSTLARTVVAAVREIDRDIRRATEGTADLGTVATLGLFGAGATRIATSGELQMPPWFNLAWWGIRTFMTTERDEIDAAHDDNVEGDW